MARIEHRAGHPAPNLASRPSDSRGLWSGSLANSAGARASWGSKGGRATPSPAPLYPQRVSWLKHLSLSLRCRDGGLRAMACDSTGEVRFPVLHEPTPTLEQVRAPIRYVDLITDVVCRRCLRYSARVIRLLGCPASGRGGWRVRPFSHDPRASGGAKIGGRRMIVKWKALLAFALVGCVSPAAYPEFRARLDAGADCPELFEIRNEVRRSDPSSADRMNEDLRSVGCFSSTSSRS